MAAIYLGLNVLKVIYSLGYLRNHLRIYVKL